MTHNNPVISNQQFQSALDCLDDSEEDGSLGKRVQTLRLVDGEFGGEITSKGVWLEDD